MPSEPLLSSEHERVRRLLNAAHARARLSLKTADELLASGFPSAALVWAVRSVEIYVKEFLLAPAYFVENGGDWMSALRRAGRKFGSGRWTPAYQELQRLLGPIDEMRTDTDGDAWRHWESVAVGMRGDIVHGRFGADETDEENARWAIQYAEQLFTQLTMRMLVGQKHPAYTLFAQLLETLHDERSTDLTASPDEAPQS